MSRYPRGNYTIVEDEIAVTDKDLNQTFDQLLIGLQTNKYIHLAKESEITAINKPHYIKMNIYTYIGEYGIDKYTSYLEATLYERDDSVIVRIHIFDDFMRTKVIQDDEIYDPIIIQRISIDLTGTIDPALRKRLFPQKHIDIVKFEDKLVLFIVAFIIVSFIFVEIPYYWYMVFGLIGIYALYYLIDLLRN